MTAQHVIVTGAAGYVGRHVVTALLDAGADVTAVVRPGRGARVDERAAVVELDLLDPATDLSPLLDPAADALVHLAWEAGFTHASPQHMLRLSDHFRVLDAFSRAGVGRIAALGTMHEIGRFEGAITAETPTNPLSLYGIAKDALRRALLAHVAPRTTVQWLRAFYILGDDRENQSIFTKLLEASDAGRTTFPFTSGTAQFDFIQVDELGRQIATVALQDEVQGVVNVCSGEPVALGVQVERFIEAHGLDIALEYGAYPDRPYDSKVVYGDATEIRELMARAR